MWKTELAQPDSKEIANLGYLFLFLCLPPPSVSGLLVLNLPCYLILQYKQFWLLGVIRLQDTYTMLLESLK